MNIREHLIKTLNNPNLLCLVPDHKVYFMHANGPDTPYIECEILSESGADYSEGTEDYTNFIIQVDIFSHSNYSKIESEILKIMEEANFIRSRARDLWEGKTGLFHKVIRFNISLPREE